MACTGPGYPSDYYTNFENTMILHHIPTTPTGGGFYVTPAGFSFYDYMWDGYVANGCGWWQQKATQFETQMENGTYPGQYVGNVFVPNPNPASPFQMSVYRSKFNLCAAMALICCGITITYQIYDPNSPVAPPPPTSTMLSEAENETAGLNYEEYEEYEKWK